LWMKMYRFLESSLITDFLDYKISKQATT